MSSDKWQLFVGYYHLMIMVFRKRITAEQLQSKKALFIFDSPRREVMVRDQHIDAIAQIWRMGHIGRPQNGDAINASIAMGRQIHIEVCDIIRQAESEDRVLYTRETNGSPVYLQDGCALLTLLARSKVIRITQADRNWWRDMSGVYPNITQRIGNSFLSDYIEVVDP